MLIDINIDIILWVNINHANHVDIHRYILFSYLSSRGLLLHKKKITVNANFTFQKKRKKNSLSLPRDFDSSISVIRNRQ